MIVYDVEQNTPEWHAVRAGKPTASCFDKICTPTGKRSTQADTYANQLIAEMIIGGQVETWEGNKWSERGHALEQEAAGYYEQVKDCKLEKIGFVTDDAGTIGASPDRVVIGKKLLVEIKCPSPAVHIRYLLNDEIDQGYYSQLQGQLLVTGFDGVDIISYCPGLPSIIIPTDRDPIYLGTMKKMLADFNELLATKRKRMVELGHMVEA